MEPPRTIANFEGGTLNAAIPETPGTGTSGAEFLVVHRGYFSNVAHSGARSVRCTSSASDGPFASAGFRAEVDLPVAEAGLWFKYDSVPLNGLIYATITLLSGSEIMTFNWSLNTNSGGSPTPVLSASQLYPDPGDYVTLPPYDHMGEWLQLRGTSTGLLTLSDAAGTTIATASTHRPVPMYTTRVYVGGGTGGPDTAATIFLDDFYYVPAYLNGSFDSTKRTFLPKRSA
ncbi:hypothetical protein GCM10028801_31070 [Nocardioides maradonensis]